MEVDTYTGGGGDGEGKVCEVREPTSRDQQRM